MIGETLDGKYRLLRLLGEGGMGAVYEARHTETNRRVAVKVIRGDRTDKKGAENVRRFQREAKAAGAIDTQHIAQVLDAGTDEARGVPYITLEYLEGDDLQQLLKRIGVLRPDVALRIAGQACIGLLKAHEARVFHRDIKPANIFVARREEGEVQVKLLDFGIAKMRKEEDLQAETTGLTRTGSLIGSPLYMSPEQARSLPGLDGRSDLWSLGVVLYRALAGRAPHEEYGMLGGLIYAICAEPAEPIRNLAPWVSADIAAVVHRALQINRDARFQTAAEMLAAIKALTPGGLSLRQEDLVTFEPPERAQRVSQASAAAEVETLLTSQSGAQSVPVPPAPDNAARRAKGSRMTLPIGAALALGLGVFGAYKVATPSTSPASSVQNAAITTSPPVEQSAAPTPSAAALPVVEKSARKVRVEVAPRDVSVEVDGAKVAVVDAFVEIEGELGSLHKVRLFKDGREQVAEVIVSADGPKPAKLELVAAPVAGKESAPVQRGLRRPAAATPPDPSVAPTRAAKPLDPALPDQF